jgi:hypothetical protein
MRSLFLVDGIAFVLIGLVVLATPSPQPALVRPVDEAVALAPFEETRRLLASQFLGAGLLAAVFGALVHDPGALRAAALARIVTIAVVVSINVAQLRAGHWKRAPLYVISSVLSAIALGYAALLLG